MQASSTNFSAVNVEAAAALNCLSSYNEIVGKLNRLWDDQIIQIHNVTDVCIIHTYMHLYVHWEHTNWSHDDLTS